MAPKNGPNNEMKIIDCLPFYFLDFDESTYTSVASEQATD